MPKITAFMFASSVTQESTTQGMLTHVINPLPVIVPPYFPTIYSFSIVFGIRDFDYLVNHNIKVELFYPDAKDPMLSTATDLSPIAENKDVNIPAEYHGFIVSLTFQNVDINVEGIYKIYIYFDDDKIDERDIYIARKKMNE